MSVLYHPDKGNVFADAISRVSTGSVSHTKNAKKYLLKDVHRLDRLCLRLENSPNGGFMVHHISESSLVVEVKFKQHLDQSLMELKELVPGKFNDPLSLGGMVS